MRRGLHLWSVLLRDVAQGSIIATLAGASVATVSGLRVSAVASGSIAGQVTRSPGGEPTQGICASAYTVGGGSGSPVDTASTATDGTYSISALPPGNYDVSFDSEGYCSGGVVDNFATQWYSNQPSQSAANPVAVQAGSATPSIDATMAPSAPAGLVYTPVTPFRIWDTRASSAVQCSNPNGCALGPGGLAPIQVWGNPSGNGSVPTNAVAVVLNLTGISPTANTFLAVQPSGGAAGTTSNLNLVPGAIQANLGTVGVPSRSGMISVYNNAGTTDVALDLEGYFTPSRMTPASSGAAGTFHPITPKRVCDTRGGQGTPCNGGTDNPFGPGESRAITVTSGSGAIPTDGTAASAVFNLTAVGGTKGTYLTAYPPQADGSCPRPATSNLNVNAATNLPNRVIVPIGTTGAALGKVCLFNLQGSINLIVDVNGWFGTGAEPTVGALFFQTAPMRICDTRTDQGPNQCKGRSIQPNSSLTVNAVGTATGDPTSPVAVVMNATGISGTADTFLSLFPDGNRPSPLTSDLNPSAGENVANLVIVALGSGGSSPGGVDVYNLSGVIDTALDVQGWFQ
jgi:hypothetical protein